MLTRPDRRRLRQVARGLRVTDPDWARRHDPPWRVRAAQLARLGADLAAFVLVLTGALEFSLPLLFAGIVLATGGITAHVSSFRGTAAPPER